MIGLAVKHVTDHDEIDLIQTIVSKHGFGMLEERGDDLVAALFDPITPDAIASMDRELVGRIGGHLELLLS